MKRSIISFASFLFTLVAGISFAQIPQYSLSAQSFTMDSGIYRTVEWDIYLKNTGSVPLEYLYGEYFFDFEPYIAQGGNLTLQLAGSDLPSELRPRNVSINGTILRLLSIAPAPPGAGYFISSSGYGTKIAKVRLKTTATSIIVNNIHRDNEMNLFWRTGPSYPFTKIMANVGKTLYDITNSSDTYVSPNFYGMFIWQTIPWESYNARLLNLNTAIEGLFNSTTGKLNKTDTVTIEIRDPSFPYSLLSSFKSRVDSVSLATFSVQSVPVGFGYPGSMYIVVKHRNSIETWSRAVTRFSRGGFIKYYSILDSASSAYGNNLKLVDSTYCLYSGDVNQDKIIDLTDLIMVYEDAINFSTGYIVTDINGDNVVNSEDLNIVYNNSISFVRSITPF